MNPIHYQPQGTFLGTFIRYTSDFLKNILKYVCSAERSQAKGNSGVVS